MSVPFAVMCKFKILLLITFILTFGFISNSWGQVTAENIRGAVLKKGIRDSLFIFNFSRPNDHNETQLKYLGTLESKDGRIFKIMSYCWIWGLSHRATNRILIYNKKNQYLGNYGLETKDKLPQKIENNELIFNVKSDENSKEVETRISFAQGLPKTIYIKNGNLYHFQGD